MRASSSSLLKGQNLALGEIVELAHGLRPQDFRLVDWLYCSPPRRRALGVADLGFSHRLGQEAHPDRKAPSTVR
jgi:hypothetical protein